MTWLEVLDGWRQSEEEGWRPVYESRGFTDWWSWRQTYVSHLALDRRTWSLETMKDPLAEIPKWFIGGYKGWRMYVSEGIVFPTFADVVKHSLLRENKKVMDLVGFMRSTRLIGLRCGGEIVVVDGTHRAAAIALMAKDGGHTVPPIELAVTDVEQETFDQFRRGRTQISSNISTDRD